MASQELSTPQKPFMSPTPSSSTVENGSSRNRDAINSQIEALLKAHTTPLTHGDFDMKVRQCLHAIFGKGGHASVKEALATVVLLSSKKKRGGVQNWPAYLGSRLDMEPKPKMSDHVLVAQRLG